MSTEKDMTMKREGPGSDDLERITTVYDDNFHGLSVKTVLVYVVCITYLVS